PPASSPPPRLRARSMLSFGTEFFFAFWMASNRVGLPAGSPPPVRAATSMFLMSFAHILPPLASMTAFLCLVVAHLEWPLIRFEPLPAKCGRRQPTGRSVDSTRSRCGPPARWPCRHVVEVVGRAPRSGGRAHGLHEEPVHAMVAGDLGMEGGRDHGTLTHRDHPARRRPVRHRGQDLDVGPDLLHPRCADEHRTHGPVVEA